MNTRRARNPKPVANTEGVFKFSYTEAGDSNQGRKRHRESASTTRPEKSSRQGNDNGKITSPHHEADQRNFRHPAPAANPASSQVPASPAFNLPSFPMFKQSTPMHKAAEKNERSTAAIDRKRASPMKNASMYKTPEKKKRIYSSDEEELEFSPSGRRMPIDERRNLLQNATQWSARVDQEERFHGVYVRSVERLKRRLLSESLQSVETSTTCSETSETSLDLSSYEVDESVLTRRQKQIAYGKNTPEYEYFARKVDKMNRTRKDPQTPDKFDLVSRRRFDGRIRTWRVQIHRWYEQHVTPAEGGAVKHVPLADENTVTVQGAPSEGTMTEAPVSSKHMQSSPVKHVTRFCASGQNILGLEDESAVDAFQSPKKAATGKGPDVHTELTCDLAGFAICNNSQSTLTGPPAATSNSYQTRSRARLVFS